MLIPRHWAREIMKADDGREHPVLGWSDESPEAARAHARTRWAEVLARLAGKASPVDDYKVPVREPILRELDAPGVRAVITRNRYGAQVLNCENLCFLDIDKRWTHAPAMTGLTSLWNLLCGKPSAPAAPEARLVERVKRVATETGLSIRVYRTLNGWRLAVLNRRYDPRSKESEALFGKFAWVDFLYRDLCRKQGCYRARLTPKPWRIKATGFPDKTFPRVYPWRTPEQAAAADAWVRRYEEASTSWRVCEHVGDFGAGVPDRDILAVLAVHDELTGIGRTDGKLA